MRHPWDYVRRAMCWHRCWRRNEDGATAVEFAIVAMPFFLFTLGILATGHLFFATSYLEHSVETAARAIRTGLAQQGNSKAVPPVPPMTVKQFKESVCNNAAGVIDCTGLRVHVQSGTSWSDIEPVACLDSGGNLATGTGADTDALSTLTGGASAVVLVTVCYEWDLVADVPLLDALGNMQSGGTLVQVATTFRTEPY